MAVTRTEAEAILVANNFRPYAEHAAEMGIAAEGMENCWIDSYGDWVIKLSETGYELTMDGDDEVVNNGPFDHLADELHQYDAE